MCIGVWPGSVSSKNLIEYVGSIVVERKGVEL